MAVMQTQPVRRLWENRQLRSGGDLGYLCIYDTQMGNEIRFITAQVSVWCYGSTTLCHHAHPLIHVAYLPPAIGVSDRSAVFVSSCSVAAGSPVTLQEHAPRLKWY